MPAPAAAPAAPDTAAGSTGGWLAPSTLLAGAALLYAAGARLPAGDAAWREPALRALLTLAGLAAALLVVRALGWLVWDRLLPRWSSVRAPRLLRQFVAVTVMVAAGLLLLTGVWNVPLPAVLATTGVLGLVLGLALRRILTDFFSGIALNIEQPFRLDDFILLHTRPRREPIAGRVREITWRSTRILTPEDNLVSVPNSVVAASVVENLSFPSPVSEQEVDVLLDWNVPAPRLEAVLHAAVTEAWARGAVAGDKAPKVRVCRLDGAGVTYRITYLLDPRRKPKGPARHELLSCVHRHLRLAGLRPVPESATGQDPWPPAQRPLEPGAPAERAAAIAEPELFASLGAAQREALAASMTLREFEAGEQVVAAGAAGDSMYLVAAGAVAVRVPGADGQLQLRTALGAGACFGEMSLLTGEPRSATIVALTPLVLYEIAQAQLAPLLAAQPALADALAHVVAGHRRRDEAALAAAPAATSAPTLAAVLAGRIRALFGLAPRAA